MLRQMKDSGLKWVEQIPTDWEVFPLYKFVRQVKCLNFGNREKNLLSLSYGTIKRKDMETASGLVPKSYEGYNIIEAGDIVLRLTDLQNDKRSIRVGRSTERGIVTSAYVTIRPSKECSSAYLRYSVLGFDIAKGFYGIGSGVREGLNYDEVKKLLFPFPPLPEQQAIAAKLDALTSRIDSESKKITAEIARLDAYKKSIITEVVCRGLDPKAKMKESGIPWVGKIPERWSVVRAGHVMYEVNDRSVDGKEEPLSMSQVHGIVRSCDIEVANPASSYVGAKIVMPGDLVLNKLKAHLGVFAVSQYHGLVSPDYAVYRAKAQTSTNYLNRIFHSVRCISEFRRHITGVVVGFNRLYTSELFTIKLPLPPLNEQRTIADYLDATCARVDAIVAKRKRQLDRLDALKRSLVYEYVTGKRVVV